MIKRWRFSIRSMLIGLVFVAMLAAVYGYRWRRVEMVNDFVEAAESAGVDVEVAWWPELTLRRLMQGRTAETISRRCGFPRIVTVKAAYPSEYATWFQKLIDSGGAEYVFFIGSDFGREHIDALSRLDTVRELEFCSDKLAADIGISLSQMQNLESLEFRAPGGVSQRAIQSISQLPSLVYLETDADLEAAKRFQSFQSSQSMEGLSLRLLDAPQPYPWVVFSNFPHLERIELDGISTDANIAELVVGAPKLRRLVIDLEGASDEGCRLLARLPRLERLEVSHLPRDADALGGLSAVTELTIRSSTISAAGMKELRGCPIETLDLSSTQVEGGLLEGIRSWGHLTRIELINTNVTKAHAQDIRKWKQWERFDILP